MNIKEYIESGILELYLLGALSASESAEVTAMVSKYPELQDELNALEWDMLSVAEFGVPEQLDMSILNKAMSRIEENTTEVKVEETKVIPIASNVISSNSSTRSIFKSTAIAASVLLLLSLGLNYTQYKNKLNTQNQLADFNSKVENLIKENENNTLKASDLSKQLRVLADASTSKVTLKGVEGKESALATVFWNNETKQTFLSINNLPTPPKGMQYQLWALADGVPVDAGVFDLEDSKSIQIAKNIQSAQTFAITLEEAGGKPTPNLAELYVIGNV